MSDRWQREIEAAEKRAAQARKDQRRIVWLGVTMSVAGIAAALIAIILSVWL